MAKAVRGSIRMELQDADELSSALSGLPIAMRRGVLQKAVRKAGRVMVPALRRATPKSKKKFGFQAERNPPGTTRKSTGIAMRKYKGGAIAAAYIGHRWPKGAAAHLVDAGTKQRETKKYNGRQLGWPVNKGQVKGVRFFAPVYAAHAAQVRSTLRDQLAIGIEDARQKAAAKGRKVV